MQRWHLASVNSCNAKKLWRNVINANVSTNVYKKGLSLGGRVLIATAQSANSTTPGKQVKHAIVLSARPNDRWRFSMQVNNIQTMPTNIATNVHMGTWLSNMWKREFSCWNLMKPTASNCAQLFKPPSQQHIRRAACFGLTASESAEAIRTLPLKSKRKATQAMQKDVCICTQNSRAKGSP